MKKKILFLFLFGILIFSSVHVLAEKVVCCEKLNQDAGGAWCQDSQYSNCDLTGDLRFGIGLCTQTDWCAPGTCINSAKGYCSEDVSRVVCNKDNGKWDPRPISEVPQCKKACCFLGGETGVVSTHFVDQAKCNELSSKYGLEINFREDITSEAECSLSAKVQEKGACVYEEDFSKTCSMVTRVGCTDLESSKQNVLFYPGILCSNEDLGVDCGPSKKTTLVEGEDEIFYVDTCGNLANIYDSDWEQTKQDYWQVIYSKEDSCGYKTEIPSGNLAKSCGNCDYQLGSTGYKPERGETRANQGDYICKDLGCSDEKFLDRFGRNPKHGESWCANSGGVDLISDESQNRSYLPGQNPEKANLPGSRYSKMFCFDGKVDYEECGDFRDQFCSESSVETSDGGTFSNAVCVKNKWQDCTQQLSKENCENTQERLCNWVSVQNPSSDKKTSSIIEFFLSGSPLESFPFAKKGTDFEFKTSGDVNKGEFCVPNFQPGFDFWKGDGNGDLLCGIASIGCDYEVDKSLFGGKRVKDGAECIKEDASVKDGWIKTMDARCMAIGDCGPKKNYLGFLGEKQQNWKKEITG